MTADEHQAALTERILGAVFEVSNTLGAGFPEKVYERALLRELRLRGLAAVSQAAFPVIYKGVSVGNFLGGRTAAFYESMPLTELFVVVALLPVVAGTAMFLFRRPLAELIGDIR